MNEGEDDGERGITDGRVGNVRTREGTVVSQIGRWVTCERKGTVAVVSLMGDMRMRADGRGATGGWTTCKRERGRWGHGWTTCKRKGMVVLQMGDVQRERTVAMVSRMGDV